MKNFFKYLVILSLFIVVSCSPSLGSSWYSKSGGKGSSAHMYVTSIKVINKDVTAKDVVPRSAGETEAEIFARTKRFSIFVPYSVKEIDIDSIQIEAYEDAKKQKSLKVSLEIEGDSVSLVAGETVSVLLRVKDDTGKYPIEEKIIAITREEGEDNSSDSEDPDNEDTNKPDPKNPKDENGNLKFDIRWKITKEELDPFEYYKEDANGFSASRFEDWILNITSITTTNVASYAFKPGIWTGMPLQCDGPEIGGNQLNKSWNLKYYKYRSQEERWRERGGYVNPLDSVEKQRRERFLFFKFTGEASANTKLDNSMFCVDTHTKFLFFYSDPANIKNLFGNKIPSNWKDYDEPSEGEHVHSEKAFYLTDPIGYVQEDGKCVIYSWCKRHIEDSNYKPSIDNNFKKVASRKVSGQGFSPYKNKVLKVNKEKILTNNPKYTATKPLIIMQSNSMYLKLAEAENAILSVKVQEVPEGEELSYQWYKNASNSTRDGQEIVGANEATYKMPKEVTDVYCYCVIKNKNTANNQEAKTISQPVKVRIVEAETELKVDAEIPFIKSHPKSSKHEFVEGNSVNISLKVDVLPLKDGGVLSYEWYEAQNYDGANPRKIDGAISNIYNRELSNAGIKYYYCKIINTNNNATGEKQAYILSSIAKVEIEALAELSVGCTGEGTLRVIGANDGKATVLSSGQEKKIQVKIPSELFFIATEEKGWKIEKWEDGVEVLGDIHTVQLKITSSNDLSKPIFVYFSKIPKKGKLGITNIRVENESLDGELWLKHYDGAYFIWDILATSQDDSPAVSQSLWKNDTYRFLYTQGFGKSAYFMPKANQKNIDINMENDKATLKLDLKLTKRDAATPISGDHTWIMVDHDKSVVEFKYDVLKDCWFVKNVNYNLEKVNVEYKKDFILKRGLERDFTISYTADNPDLCATGTIKVVYTLSWE